MPTLLDRADFTYGNTRLRARRTTLLGATLERLPHHEVDELIAALDPTPYGSDLDAAGHTTGLDRLHHAINAHLTRALRDTVEFYDGPARSTVELLLHRWDGPNTVAVVRAAAGRAPLASLVDVGAVDAAAAHEAASQPDAPAAADLLVAWRVPGPNLAAALRSTRAGVDLDEVERRILRGAHADLDEAVDAAGPAAAPVAALVRAERDRRTLALALRLHDAVAAGEVPAGEVDALAAREATTATGTIDAPTIVAAALADTRRAAVATVTNRVPSSWQRVLAAWASGTPTAGSERELTALVAATAAAGFVTGDPLGAAVPTAWIAAKEDEARRLRHLGALAAGMATGNG